MKKVVELFVVDRYYIKNSLSYLHILIRNGKDNDLFFCGQTSGFRKNTKI